jgi:DNA-binding Xre family transcriptional regulator
MKASYKKLWKLLIDKDMKRKELMEQAGISSFSIRKLSRGENVTMEVLGKICKVLNCTLDDICEFEETDS